MQGLDKHSFCEHGKRRSLCKEGCGWGSVCEHGKKRSNCPEEVCGKHLFCEHGKRRNCCNKGCGKQPSAVPSADIVVTGTFAAVSLLQPHVPDRRATREAHAASRLDVFERGGVSAVHLRVRQLPGTAQESQSSGEPGIVLFPLLRIFFYPIFILFIVIMSLLL